MSDTASQPPPGERVQRTRRIAQYEARIAALEAELAEARERLAMAVEALKCVREEFCFAECHEDGWHHPRCRKAENALAATAEAVAQHTARVERRGAKAALEAFAERDDWTLDVPRSLVDRIRRLLTAEARAAEVERLDSDKT